MDRGAVVERQEQLEPGDVITTGTPSGVVSGVRDYGNRMGIPTVNGAIYFDERFVGNPLVYCGNVGVIPRDKIDKAARPGDAIVVMGGRTGRDGIHGATFSSGDPPLSLASLKDGRWSGTWLARNAPSGPVTVTLSAAGSVTCATYTLTVLPL